MAALHGKAAPELDSVLLCTVQLNARSQFETQKTVAPLVMALPLH